MKRRMHVLVSLIAGIAQGLIQWAIAPLLESWSFTF
jgi:hypothetical protein